MARDTLMQSTAQNNQMSAAALPYKAAQGQAFGQIMPAAMQSVGFMQDLQRSRLEMQREQVAMEEAVKRTQLIEMETRSRVALSQARLAEAQEQIQRARFERELRQLTANDEAMQSRLGVMRERIQLGGDWYGATYNARGYPELSKIEDPESDLIIQGMRGQQQHQQALTERYQAEADRYRRPTVGNSNASASFYRTDMNMLEAQKERLLAEWQIRQRSIPDSGDDRIPRLQALEKEYMDKIHAIDAQIEAKMSERRDPRQVSTETFSMALEQLTPEQIDLLGGVTPDVLAEWMPGITDPAEAQAKLQELMFNAQQRPDEFRRDVEDWIGARR